MPFPIPYIERQIQEAQKTIWMPVLNQTQVSVDIRSGPLEVPYASGLWMQVKMANESGTASFHPWLLMKNGSIGPVIWKADTAITANGQYNYLIHPLTISNSSFTQVSKLVLPRVIEVYLDYIGTAGVDKADITVHVRYI